MHASRPDGTSSVGVLDWVGLLWTLGVLAAYLRSVLAGV